MQIWRIVPIFALFVICASVTSVNAATQISTTTIGGESAVVLENDEISVSIIPDRGWRVYRYIIKATDTDIIAHDAAGDEAAQHKVIGNDPGLPIDGDVFNENYAGAEDRFTNIGTYKGDVEWRAWDFGISALSSMILQNNSTIVQVYNKISDFLEEDQEGKTWISGATLYKVYTLVNGSNALRMDYKLEIGANGYADLLWAYKAQLSLGGSVDSGDRFVIDGAFYRQWAHGPIGQHQADTKYDWPGAGMDEYKMSTEAPSWTGEGGAGEASAEESQNGKMKSFVKSRSKYAVVLDTTTGEYVMLTLPYKALKVDGDGNEEFITFAQYYGLWITYDSEHEPMQYSLEPSTTPVDLAGSAKEHGLPIIELSSEETLYWTVFFIAGNESLLDVSTSTTDGTITGNAILQALFNTVMAKYLTDEFEIDTTEWGITDYNDPADETKTAVISAEEENLTSTSDSGFLGICGPTILLGVILGPLAIAAKKLKK